MGPWGGPHFSVEETRPLLRMLSGAGDKLLMLRFEERGELK